MVRDLRAAKIAGTKLLAVLLAAGLGLAAPVTALAQEEPSASGLTAEAERLQAKRTDGTEELTEVSDAVLALIETGEVKLNEETGYLEDVQTGQKVDPETGERMEEPTEEPENPSDTGQPDTGQPEEPDTGQPDSGQAGGEPADAGTSGEVQTPSDTGQPEDTQTPSGAEDAEEPADDTETSTKEQDTEAAGDEKYEEAIRAAEEEAAEDPDAANSNEELIARQTLVKLPEIVEDFRFWTVARKYAFAKTVTYIREEIPEGVDGSADSSDEAVQADIEAAKKDAAGLEASYKKDSLLLAVEALSGKAKKSGISSWNMEEALEAVQKAASVQSAGEQTAYSLEAAALQASEQARPVGTIAKDGLLYILKEEENGWLYVESGNVRGFVKASEVYTGDAAQELLTVYQEEAKKTAEEAGEEYAGIEGTAETAKAAMDASENQAYTYLRATVNQTVVDPVYALADVDVLNIREEKSEESRIVGTMKQGELCCILADEDSEWLYVESGDVRGFVKSEYLVYGEEAAEQVEAAGEDAYGTAEEQVEPADNGALYYTLTSTKTGTPGGEIRQSLLEYAAQFIGNPYVWGGNSLTDGVDCSGFAQQIYKAYGYDLPRTASEQSQCGTQIAVEDARPGDLIFYAKNGHVYHVALYAGDGKTIEAANQSLGIIQGTVYSQDAVWAVRLLEDNYVLAGAGISEVNATEEMYGDSLGDFTITYYCSCELCCDKADGITATGVPVVEGQTIAVDPSVIPYGTQVIIGGHVFTAEDCGGAIKQNRIDVYVHSHAQALALGVTQAEVYLVK